MTSIVQGISVGTVAFYLGKRADAMQSHKWTVHVRGADNENLGWLFEKVVFNLHESFQNPARVVYQQPYEVTETGWGEFDISVELHLNRHFTFASTSSNVLVVKHGLRLYPDDDATQTVKRPVVGETYEEIVIQTPTPAMWQRYNDRNKTKMMEYKNQQHFKTFNSQHEMMALSLSRQKVTQHTTVLRAKLEDLHAKIRASKSQPIVRSKPYEQHAANTRPQEFEMGPS